MATLEILQANLNRKLLDAGDALKKRWWEKYLKAFNLFFYGVPMAKIRSISLNFWDENELDLEFILGLFKIPVAEPKLAAIVLLETRYLDKIVETEIHRLQALFDNGFISDWHICDWFCVKFLAKLWCQRPEFRGILQAWNCGDTIWQRRASVVMFVPFAKTCTAEEATVMVQVANGALGPTRFEQTGVAWLMAELSITHKELVAEWIKKHSSVLTKEAFQRASKRLSKTDLPQELGNKQISKKRKI
jgi:3-methyladenine DNA glycosylase AlkD